MDIAKITKSLIYKDPFYGHFALGIDKKFSNLVSTACVTINGINTEMHFCEDFVNTLNEKQQIGLMQHELGHIALFHLIHAAKYQNIDVWNIACDITINQYIEPEYLPPKPCLPSSFPELNLDPFMDTEYYYNKLISGIESSPKLKSLLNFMKGGGKTAFSHELWRMIKEMPDSTRHLVQKQIEHQIKNVYENNFNKNIGLIPGNLRNFVMNLYEVNKAITDWRAVMMNFKSFCDKQIIKFTRNRINKRYEDFDAVTLRRRQKILIGIDTSGSISNDDLQKFFQQVLHISKCDIDVDVCEWDYGIQRIYNFNKKEKVNNKNGVKGGGGTNPYQVIDMLNKSKDYNAAIMFTDGFIAGDWDKNVCKPVLWIITQSGDLNFNFPGKKIKAIN